MGQNTSTDYHFVQPEDRKDSTPEHSKLRPASQREQLRVLFQAGYTQWRACGKKDATVYFRPWASKAYANFASTRNPQDLADYLDGLALRVCGIVKAYQDAGTDDTGMAGFFNVLVTTLKDCDVPHIWHNRFKLRPMHDVSLKAQLLLEIVLQLGHSDMCPERDTIQLFDVLIAQAERLPQYEGPGSYSYTILRAALVAKGEYCLEQGQIDEAIALARRAFAANALCFTAEALLVRAWRAKLQAHPAMPLPTEVSVHDLSDRFCPEPFNSLVSGWEGGAHLCRCPQWVPFKIGNLLQDASVDTIWNSEAAMEIRRSVIDGDFSYCSRSSCPAIIDQTLPKKSEVTDPVLRYYIDNRITRLDTAPTYVQLNYDPSCNLACPSCRTRVIMAKQDEVDRYQAAKDRVVLPLLRHMHGNVLITGGGDLFASKHWRSVIAALNPTDYPGLKLELLTNGLLVAKHWHQFPALGSMIGRLDVSIDAARPETYAIVRYPGRWEDLRPNLVFLAELRRSGALPFFGINFVVQRDNFREMLEFVQLGKALGVDAILFQRMFNFGSFEEEAFRARDVASPSHPDHAELCEIFQHPLLNDPIVTRFTLASLNSGEGSGPLYILWRGLMRTMSRDLQLSPLCHPLLHVTPRGLVRMMWRRLRPRPRLRLDQIPLKAEENPAAAKVGFESVSRPRAITRVDSGRLMERAWRYMAEGKLHDALQVAGQIPATAPFDYYALVLIAHIRTTMGDYERAEQAVRDAIALSAKRPEAYMCQAWLHYHQGRFADGLVALALAEQAARDVEQVDDRVTEQLLLVGAWLSYRVGHAGQALEKVEHYLALQPDDTDARQLRDAILAS